MPQVRIQFAFWMRAELGDRLRAYCERSKRYQRDVAEQAIESFLNQKDPSAAGGPAAGGVSFPPPAPVPGFDSQDEDKP